MNSTSYPTEINGSKRSSIEKSLNIENDKTILAQSINKKYFWNYKTKNSWIREKGQIMD